MSECGHPDCNADELAKELHSTKEELAEVRGNQKRYDTILLTCGCCQYWLDGKFSTSFQGCREKCLEAII